MKMKLKSSLKNSLKDIRWRIVLLALAAFIAVSVAETFFHPWDEMLENSSAGVMSFEVLNEAPAAESGGGFWDRVDQMKAEIGRFLFSDETPGFLSKAAHKVLSPIEDAAKSISLALSYSDLFDGHTPDPFFNGLILIVFFLLYYGFLFAQNKVLSRIKAKNPIEEYAVGYCVEGVSAFLCLFMTYWVVMGMKSVDGFGLLQVFYGGMSSGNALIVIPSAILMLCVMGFFVVLIVSLFICVLPYYFLIALPVMLVAILPFWMWLKLLICLVLEVVIIVKAFPWLFERLNLWNTVCLLTKIVFFIPRMIFHLFSGS